MSLFVCEQNTVVTVESGNSALLSLMLERLKKSGIRTRLCGHASLLAYAIMDTLANACFPILERYGDKLEDLESGILAKAAPGLIQVMLCASSPANLEKIATY